MAVRELAEAVERCIGATVIAGQLDCPGDNDGVAGQATLVAPNGIAIGGDGTIYVSSQHTIRAVKAGLVRTHT